MAPLGEKQDTKVEEAVVVVVVVVVVLRTI